VSSIASLASIAACIDGAATSAIHRKRALVASS
jgi:hypothetical protein